MFFEDDGIMRVQIVGYDVRMIKERIKIIVNIFNSQDYKLSSFIWNFCFDEIEKEQLFIVTIEFENK